MIRCWTICSGALAAGIRVIDGFIHVGESGRGRQLVRVPVPDGAVIEDNLLQAAPPPRLCPEAVAVVLIMDHSGYRGTWRLAEYATGLCPFEGQYIEGQCQTCGGSRNHRLIPAADVDVASLGLMIAEGRRAQGIAGYVGGGAEYLLALRPCRFSIRRRGRLYGSPAVWNVAVGSDGTITLTDALSAIMSARAQERW